VIAAWLAAMSTSSCTTAVASPRSENLEELLIQIGLAQINRILHTKEGKWFPFRSKDKDDGKNGTLLGRSVFISEHRDDYDKTYSLYIDDYDAKSKFRGEIMTTRAAARLSVCLSACVSE
jgi:hypothetical protein